ncbi:NAD(P)-bd-dom domain-containing protein [Mycena indigotica]|uniref:NAD(P)-bd-dom domain-containing protein n=1 Tax=Mycena indigotica TaxID=2126181 RepID=A0A8H6T2W4_9AGAR|nr:NAD(P)-bd-dom domain-containing protein [Mycena indigotica]KAF7309855.1 NAD(P)-bd-dom domain-containing protein [Mycena indigotica]
MSLKIVLTGATGFVGGEVLAQCLRNPAISSIVVLSRRPLPITTHDPKVKEFIMKDFTVYTEEVKREFKEADACIWALGARAAVPEVEIDYPLALGDTILSVRSSTKPFRYVYCSGMFSERDQTKPLWKSQTVRRVKGRAESSMLDFSQLRGKAVWETYIVKPAMIIRPAGGTLKKLISNAVFGTVRVDELAAAMIELVTRGAQKDTFENAEIVQLGKEMLAMD